MTQGADLWAGSALRFASDDGEAWTSSRYMTTSQSSRTGRTQGLAPYV